MKKCSFVVALITTVTGHNNVITDQESKIYKGAFGAIT